MENDAHCVHWLHHANQYLGLVPSLGGGVAAWQLGQQRLNLWRPWAGAADCYTLACMPLVPWSNRVSAGGFQLDGVNYPLKPNRAGEPYPIHGDGWLQAWQLKQISDSTVEMTLESGAYEGSPYHYRALQRFELFAGGMQQTLSVTHTGQQPLPYGIGIHPWFERTPNTRLSAPAQGVWLSTADCLPTHHTTEFPAGWNPSHNMRLGGSLNVPLIDNAFTGWPGHAHIEWPEWNLELDLQMKDYPLAEPQNGCFLLYRPPDKAIFCFEPVSHPVDAFHLPGRPGLQVLHTGESLLMQAQWRFTLTDVP